MQLITVVACLIGTLIPSLFSAALSRDGSSPDSDGRKASPPTKLDKLRFAGYSAEFLDRVEPNGNIPDRYTLGKQMQLLLLVSLCATAKSRRLFSRPQLSSLELAQPSCQYYQSFSFHHAKYC